MDTMNFNIQNDVVVTYYEGIASIYDEDRFENSYGKFIHLQEVAVLDELMHGDKGLVLDLACGTGRLSHYAQLGADASLEMIKIAQQKHPEKGIVQCDAGALSFEDNSIDTILCFHFFMHLNHEKVQKVITECHRVLKPGGRLIFDIPSKKRRLLFNFNAPYWHGAYCIQPQKLQKLQKNAFTLNRSFGILFLPIQRFPKVVRPYLLHLDRFLSNFVFKSYCSYIIAEFIKK